MTIEERQNLVSFLKNAREKANTVTQHILNSEEMDDVILLEEASFLEGLIHGYLIINEDILRRDITRTNARLQGQI